MPKCMNPILFQIDKSRFNYTSTTCLFISRSRSRDVDERFNRFRNVNHGFQVSSRDLNYHLHLEASYFNYQR